MERPQAAPEIAIDSSTHPRYPARVLALHTADEIRSELYRLGSEDDVADKFSANIGKCIVQVNRVPRHLGMRMISTIQAYIDHKSTEALGLPAVLTAGDEEHAAFLVTGALKTLLGTARMMERTTITMKDGKPLPPGTPDSEICALGEAIRLTIQRPDNPPATVKVGRHTFDWASGVQVMGILNATPDSFSDAGKYFKFDDAVRRAYEMAAQGATMIEVGGQSAQPGTVISVEEELRRIVPLIERLDKEIGLPLAVDTFRVGVARGAVAAGAVYINDIGGGEDEGMARLAAETGVLLGIMHLRGRPKEKQWDTTYESVMDEVTGFLHERIGRAVRAGVQREKIVLDPGLGFGKEAPQDLEVMHRFSELRSFGLPILLATSRKNYLSDTTGGTVHDLLPETAAAVAYGITQGASIIRVHDVDVMARIARLMPYLLRHTAG
jgi:dihydropteroate synthase